MPKGKGTYGNNVGRPKRKQTREVAGRANSVTTETVTPRKRVVKTVSGEHGAHTLKKTKMKRSGKTKTTTKQISAKRAKRVIKRGRKKAGN